MENKAIEIINLHKSYGDKEVLKGISLSVDKGEIFGLLGKNGAGKSTLIDCMIGLKRFNEGQILINNFDIKTKPLEVKNNFGYVPSEPLTYEIMNGKEYLEFIASCYQMSQEAFESNFNFLKNKFELSDEDLLRPIKEYSHGMKQKICLMASLIHNPSLWVLDEPTVGLDIIVYETLVKMMKSYVQNKNTIFVTSHNIDLVAEICDRVAIINDGKIDLLIDLNKEPFKRKNLKTIFFKVYGEKL